MSDGDVLRCCSNEAYADLVAQARRAVQSRTVLRPAVACILGSGLGGLANRVQHAVSLDYSEIPGFPKPSAAGHRGRLILGYLSGLPVALMQGRCHRYEGRTRREIQFPIHVLRGLGADSLIATNAAGGLNPRFEVGDLMVIDSHLDFLGPDRHPSNPIHRQTAGGGQLSLRGKSPYDPSVIRRIREIALRKGIGLNRGCYLGTLGPTYETRSEYRFFRGCGADAVGMSTIDEVLAARDLAMKVLAFSVITNVACSEVASPTTHDEVVEAGIQAGPQLMSLIEQWLEDLSGQPD